MSVQKERTIIIVWKWKTDVKKDVLEGEWDQWKTKNGDSLIRMDVPKSEAIASIRKVGKRFKHSDILIMLHNAPPNNMDEEAKAAISKAFPKEELSYRPVLFSGGKEPIYCDFSSNKLGMLGIDGKFPFRKVKFPNGEWGNASELILDRPGKIINQQHFDFIWDFYWHGRRMRILELAEEFGIRAMGASAAMSAQPLPCLAEYFQEHPVFWGKLSNFLGQEYSSPDWEYDMAAYSGYLKDKGKKLRSLGKEVRDEEGKPPSGAYFNAASLLESTRVSIKEKLHTPLKNKADAESLWSQAYNELIRLFTALPEDSL